MLTAQPRPDGDDLSHDGDREVPAKLIQTAIRLYGDHGCQAISARRIIKEAGVLNDAAIRYYFGNKQDLLRACLQAISAEFEPRSAHSWAALDARKQDPNKPVTVRHLVIAALEPLAALHASNPAALRLLARLAREEGPEGQALLVAEIGAVAWRFEDELAALIPNRPPAANRLHAMVCITTMLNCLVDQQLINTVPAAAAGRPEHSMSVDEMYNWFIDFLVSGISGDTADY